MSAIETAVMVSPEGERRVVPVNELVPLMVKGWKQAAEEAPAEQQEGK